MVSTAPPPSVSPPATSPVPSRVFPLPGWTGPINTHWGQGITGGSDLMVKASGVQPVVSMVSGTVTYVSSQATAPKSGGNAVQIHGIDGLDYYYAHLAAPLGLKNGDTVAAGQQLGMAGNSGDASSGPPHLHIGIGYGIQLGTDARGGTGKGFDAVAALKALVNNPTANNPAIVSSATQTQITTSQPAGTIQLGVPLNAPVTQSLSDRIKWLAQLLAQAGVPSSMIPVMTAISLAENGASDPNAMSSTHDKGLWQINIPTWAQKLNLTEAQLADPLTNAKAAYAVLKAQGLTAWATYNQGLAQPKVPVVQEALAGVTLPAGGGDISGSTGGTGDCGCGVWLRTPFGDVPDLGCVLMCQIGNIIRTWKENWLNWWREWRLAHIANWFFVIGGVVLVAISISLLASENKTVQTVAEVAAVT